ncbi:MAG: 4'-phosphopantetheinyl transferase superfamily protein [Oscillospiraceae bacterium]|nr:4'-phosphopantetheinyl transferase superfamily protein [Oscillospiraceae bacterium]
MIFYTNPDENSTRTTEHETAYKLLSYVLKNYYNINSFKIEKGEHGKPYLKDIPEINFNISHCKGLIVCGISKNEIGVDAEYFRKYNDKVMNRIFSSSEQEYVYSSDDPCVDFFRIWTLKESLGKYFGTGLFSDLKKYPFYFVDGVPFCEKTNGTVFTQKILYEKWVVSVCAHDPENEFIFINKTCFYSY